MYAIDYEDLGTPEPTNGQAGTPVNVSVEIDGRAVTVNVGGRADKPRGPQEGFE